MAPLCSLLETASSITVVDHIQPCYNMQAYERVYSDVLELQIPKKISDSSGTYEYTDFSDPFFSGGVYYWIDFRRTEHETNDSKVLRYQIYKWKNYLSDFINYYQDEPVVTLNFSYNGSTVIQEVLICIIPNGTDLSGYSTSCSCSNYPAPREVGCASRYLSTQNSNQFTVPPQFVLNGETYILDSGFTSQSVFSSTPCLEFYENSVNFNAGLATYYSEQVGVYTFDMTYTSSSGCTLNRQFHQCSYDGSVSNHCSAAEFADICPDPYDVPTKNELNDPSKAFIEVFSDKASETWQIFAFYELQDLRQRYHDKQSVTFSPISGNALANGIDLSSHFSVSYNDWNTDYILLTVQSSASGGNLVTGEYEVVIDYDEYNSLDNYYSWSGTRQHQYKQYLCIFHNGCNIQNPIEVLCPNVYANRDRNDESIVPDSVPDTGSCYFIDAAAPSTLTISAAHTFVDTNTSNSQTFTSVAVTYEALDSQSGQLVDPSKTSFSDSVSGSTRTVTIDLISSSNIVGTWKLTFNWKSCDKTYKKSTTLCIWSSSAGAYSDQCPNHLPCRTDQPETMFDPDPPFPLQECSSIQILPNDVQQSFIMQIPKSIYNCQGTEFQLTNHADLLNVQNANGFLISNLDVQGPHWGLSQIQDTQIYSIEMTVNSAADMSPNPSDVAGLYTFNMEYGPSVSYTFDVCIYETSDVADCGKTCPQMHNNHYLTGQNGCTNNVGSIKLRADSKSDVFSILAVSYTDGWTIQSIVESTPSSGNAATNNRKLTSIDASDVTVTFPTSPPQPEYESITIQFEQNVGGALDQYTGTYVFEISGQKNSNTNTAYVQLCVYTNDYNSECPAMADPMQFKYTDPTVEIDAYYGVTTNRHVEFTVPLSMERAGTLVEYFQYQQAVTQGHALSGNALANAKNILTDLDGEDVGHFEPDYGYSDDMIKFHIDSETWKPTLKDFLGSYLITIEWVNHCDSTLNWDSVRAIMNHPRLC